MTGVGILTRGSDALRPLRRVLLLVILARGWEAGLEADRVDAVFDDELRDDGAVERHQVRRDEVADLALALEADRGFAVDAGSELELGNSVGVTVLALVLELGAAGLLPAGLAVASAAAGYLGADDEAFLVIDAPVVGGRAEDRIAEVIEESGGSALKVVAALVFLVVGDVLRVVAEAWTFERPAAPVRQPASGKSVQPPLGVQCSVQPESASLPSSHASPISGAKLPQTGSTSVQLPIATLTVGVHGTGGLPLVQSFTVGTNSSSSGGRHGREELAAREHRRTGEDVRLIDPRDLDGRPVDVDVGESRWCAGHDAVEFREASGLGSAVVDLDL